MRTSRRRDGDRQRAASLPRPRPCRRLAMALLSGTATLVALPALAAGLTDISTIGGQNWIAGGVSGDGSVVLGGHDDNTTHHPFRWTASGGLADLAATTNDALASAASYDGTTVVGYSTEPVSGETRGFVWTQAAGIRYLGTLGGGFSEAYGVSADGSVVVGASGNASSQMEAFRWTQALGMEGLGMLNGGTTSLAAGVSSDGTIVIGSATDGNAGGSYRAIRWTQATGIESLGTLAGDSRSEARGISADGATIVGVSTGTTGTAFRWTQAGGMVALPMLNGGDYASANASNRDGTVLVGSADDGANGNASRGVRWSQSGSVLTVDQWLRDNGVSLPSDTTQSAVSVSADGNVIVGKLDNGHIYIARGPTSASTSAGLMDTLNFQQSLGDTQGLSGPLLNADLALNGAHSSPLFMLLDAGTSSAWWTGDAGHAAGVAGGGGLATGEFGFGRGLADGWTARLAGGGQYARFDTPDGGNAAFSAFYLVPEIAHVFGGDEPGGNVVATLSGYLGWGTGDIRRGYLNGTATDSSFGSAATQTFGLRARLDWRDAFSLVTTTVSPFVSYTYLNAHRDGYTETGGSFPVRFDAGREVSNALRIGADATMPLTGQIALVTRFEYGHRFEKAGAGVSGQILGLSAFAIGGTLVQQDWLRGGIGLRYTLGRGDGLVMLNTSNQTGRNATWLSASYRVTF